MKFLNLLPLSLLAFAVSCDRSTPTQTATETFSLAPRIFDAAGKNLPKVDSVHIVVRNPNSPTAAPFYDKYIDWNRHGDTIVGIPRNAGLKVSAEGIKTQSDGSKAVWWSGSASSTFSGSQTLDAQALPVPVSVTDTVAPVVAAHGNDSIENTADSIRLVWHVKDDSAVVGVINGDTVKAVGDSVVWKHRWGTTSNLTVKAGFRDRSGNWSGDSLVATRRDRVLAPVFSLAPASYIDTIHAQIIDSTPGAKIQYSLDAGSTWTDYVTALVLGSDTTLLARATKAGLTTSSVSTARYRVRSAPPTFSVANGTSSSDLIAVKLASATPGAGFEVSLDTGKTWTIYKDSIVLGRTIQLLARTVKSGLATSTTNAASYSFSPAAKPSFSPLNGTTSNDLLSVKLSSTLANAGYLFSLDTGKTWSTYTDSIVVGHSIVIYAKTVKAGLDTSITSSAGYLIKADAPTIDSQGIFHRYPTVHLNTATPNAQIRYTLDGSTPTTTSPLYADSLVVDSTCRLTAATFKSGLATSNSRVANFTLEVDGSIASSVLASDVLWYAHKTLFTSSASIGVDLRCNVGGIGATSTSPLCNDSFALHMGDTVQVASYSTKYPKLQPATARFIFRSSWNDTIHYDTLVDARDNQKYRTVVIGTQTWMAQNLNYARDSSWCYANSTDSCLKYGRLYSWPAAMNQTPINNDSLLGIKDSLVRGVCPTDWHLPSKAEWDTLWAATGTNAHSNLHLNNPFASSSLRGDDKFGFRGIAGGQRGLDGYSQYSGTTERHWTSTELFSTAASMVDLSSSGSAVVLGTSKGVGYSVRCVKN